MNEKNRILIFVLILALCMGLLSGCENGERTASKEKEKISVICTIFPEYDWAKEVIGDLGENYDITLLLDNGVDLHNYQPTAMDISKIATCDLFIYVGGESDTWVKDALKEATNKNRKVINLLEVLRDRVKEEEVIEGMEEEEEGEEEGPAYDEHVWLSLKNTQVLVSAIAESLSTIDQDHADTYRTNCDEYNTKLNALDIEYKSMVDDAARTTVLFGDRFPFRYMTDDYNLDYYAAFIGCSAETEASFETIAFLANKVDELGLRHILVIENSDQKIAKTIIKNTQSKSQEILTIDSLQSITEADIESGATYLSIMQKNLEVLSAALNE